MKNTPKLKLDATTERKPFAGVVSLGSTVVYDDVRRLEAFDLTRAVSVQDLPEIWATGHPGCWTSLGGAHTPEDGK